jgi:hypothetical protein
MKKLFFISLIGLFISMASFGSDPVDIDEKEVSPSKAVEVVNVVFDKTTEAVKSIADALKVPAEHVYSVLVKQQIIKATSFLVSSIIVLMLGIVIFTYTLRDYIKVNKAYCKKYEQDSFYYDLDDRWWILGIVIGSILFCIGLIVLLGNSSEIITGFFNPEYGAIKTIIEAL